MRKPIVIVVLIYLLFCGIYFTASIFITEPGFPLDDSWIHQVFARNLASGNGFSFNPGQPVAGATAPLWSLLLAVPQLLLGPVASGILLGVILMSAAIIAIYKMAELLSNRREIAFLTALCSALCWILVWNGLSGMESGLYSALSLWGLYYYLKCNSASDKKIYLAYILVALSFLSRPECAIFLVYMILSDIYILVKTKSKFIWPMAMRILLIAAILTPYFVFNYSSTGTIFPQTFTAKVMNKGLLHSLWGGDIKRIIKASTVFPYYYLLEFWTITFKLNYILIAAFITGIAVIGGIEFSNMKLKIIGLSIVLITFTPLMGAISPLETPGSILHNFRLIVNLFPLIFMIALIGLFQKEVKIGKGITKSVILAVISMMALAAALLIFQNGIISQIAPYLIQDRSLYGAKENLMLNEFIKNLAFGTVKLALVIGLGCIMMTGIARRVLSLPMIRIAVITVVIGYSLYLTIMKCPEYANNVNNINECDRAAGEYLAEISDTDEIVGVNDIGAIGYFSKREVLDLKGLISPEISPIMIANDSLAFEYMRNNKRIDYLAIYPGWFKYIPKRIDIFEPIKYFIAKHNTILVGDTTIVYRADWSKIGR